jgi:ribosome biogenesis GTPase
MIDLFGWGPALHTAFLPLAAQGLRPARITAQHRDLWTCITETGETNAKLSGRFVFDAAAGGFPVVGDWVGLEAEDSVIQALLPRRGVVQRRSPEGGVQILVAHVDTAFLVTSLNEDLNPRRLERYLIATQEGGLTPIIVLTKADLTENLEAALHALQDTAKDVPIIAVSALHDQGLEALHPHLPPNRTAVLLGSSGAGKSTLLNRLMGREAMATGEIRSGDDKGRHTTRHRALFRLQSGALLIDTPGVREFGLTGESEALGDLFQDVTTLMAQCRFSDCTHTTEPGCAVQDALNTGTLNAARLRAYDKLQREQAFEAQRSQVSAAVAAKQKWKKIHKNQRAKAKLTHRQTDWD